MAKCKNKEADIAVLQEQVGQIYTNHLPHINERLERIENTVIKLDKKQAYWAGGLAALVIIVPILIKLFF